MFRTISNSVRLLHHLVTWIQMMHGNMPRYKHSRLAETSRLTAFRGRATALDFLCTHWSYVCCAWSTEFESRVGENVVEKNIFNGYGHKNKMRRTLVTVVTGAPKFQTVVHHF